MFNGKSFVKFLCKIKFFAKFCVRTKWMIPSWLKTGDVGLKWVNMHLSNDILENFLSSIFLYYD